MLLPHRLAGSRSRLPFLMRGLVQVRRKLSEPFLRQLRDGGRLRPDIEALHKKSFLRLHSGFAA